MRRQGGQVRASVAFPALALFDLLREPIRMLPSSISAYINASVAQKRLQELLGVRAALGYIRLGLGLGSR